MRKLVVIALMLFCLAVLVSRIRTPKGEVISSGASTASHISGRASPEEMQSSQVRSSFRPLAVARSASFVRATPITNSVPEKILIECRGHWYPATVLQSDGERRLIHYDGYGD